MSAHTHIEFRQFRCPADHLFRAACKTVQRINSQEYEEFYKAQHTSGVLTWVSPAPFNNWLPVPKCPYENCPLIGELLADPSAVRIFAQVPAAERFYVWLSADGQRVSVPGYRGAKMPARYKQTGYTVVEATNLHDIDRLQRVRAAQTGNTIYHEMNFDAATRRAREQAPYNPDDLTVDT